MEYIGCTIKNLPQNEQYAGALNAVAINPANKAPLAGIAALGIQPTQQHISVMTSKFWGSGGVNLSVGFVSQAAAALQEKIVSHMNAWSQYCNAKFTIFQGNPMGAQVRVSLGAGGYWSYLGTDIVHIPKNQPTMNLQGFNLFTPESEYKRVVRHEICHTMGAPHEHSRIEIVAKLDPQKTIAYFQATQGWTPDEIQQQILTPISESSLLGATPHAEVDSIMCYALPASITIDGVAIPGGTDITYDDGLYMGKLYPLANPNPPVPPTPPIPVPPPSPPPSSSVTITVDTWIPPASYILTKKP